MHREGIRDRKSLFFDPSLLYLRCGGAYGGGDDRVTPSRLLK